MSALLQDFAKLKTWAVVGVSADPEKYGNIIYQDLRDANYTVYGVNPKLTEIEGDPCYPSLTSLPLKPDVVNVVVPPKVAERVVDECIALGLTRIWFQPGAESDEAIAKAEAAGLHVVANACIMLEKQPV
jgi:uncharacterized protein